jgi:hypothetical protein
MHEITTPYELLIADLGDANGRPPCDPPNDCAACLVVLDPTDRAAIRGAIKRHRPSDIGKKKGPPRGDAVVLAVLSATEWTPADVVAHRLGKSEVAAYGALHRAQVRGHVEHQRNAGYRLRSAS